MGLRVCLRCGSSKDLRFREKRADWFCDACDYSWVDESCLSPQIDSGVRIPALRAAFVSYGHTDAPDFARRLRDDLASSGCSVWLDIDNIEVGANWDVKIEAGIRETDVLLAVLTRATTRDDSICRDEVILAHAQGKSIVPVRVSADPGVRPTLLLVRRSWVDFAQDYDAALERLLRYLAGDESALEAPVAAVVAGVVPLDFGPEIARHTQGFVGREWLRAEMEKWLASPRGRAFVIVGEPGIGKSAMAAHLATTCDEVAAVHFCTIRNSRSLDPFEFVASLTGQLAGRVPGFAEALAKRQPEIPRASASDSFRELIVEPAAVISAPEATQLLIVDSLDEAATRAGETIADVLLTHASDLPYWLRVIATTRPEVVVLDRLRRLDTSELLAERADNLADLSTYVRTHVTDPPVVSRLTELAAGNFLYARMAIEALSDGTLTAGDLERLSPGFSDYMGTAFRRSFPDANVYLAQYSPLLECLVASFAPVPESVLCRATSLKREELNRRLRVLRPYLRTEGARRDRCFTLYHRALVEWITDPGEAGDYFCDPVPGHGLLADALVGKTGLGEYATRWLPRHLAMLGKWDELAQLVVSPQYVAAAFEIGPREARIHAHVLESNADWDAGRAYTAATVRPGYGGDTLAQVGTMLRAMGRIAAAVAVLERAEPLLEPSSTESTEVRVGLSDMVHLGGRYREAARDALLLKDAIASRGGISSAAYQDVVLRLAHYLKFFDVRQARAELLSLDPGAMDAGHEGTWLFAVGGSVMSLTGELDEGARLVEKALAIAERVQDSDLVARCCRRLVDYEIAADEPDLARAELLWRQGLDAAEIVGSRNQVYLSTTRGEIHRRAGDYGKAASCYDRGLRLAEDSGIPGWVGHALLGRAECTRLAGGDLTEILRRAHQAYSSIDQTWGLLHCRVTSVLSQGCDHPGWKGLLDLAEEAEAAGYEGDAWILTKIHAERNARWHHPLLFP